MMRVLVIGGTGGRQALDDFSMTIMCMTYHVHDISSP
jgi:hypothetical protein